MNQVGSYQIESILGEGAVAVVYRAHPVAGATGQASGNVPSPIALKVLRPTAIRQPHVLASFQFEGRVLSRLNHPGILRVYDSGVDSGVNGEYAYIAMELISGMAFDRYLLARKRLPEAEAVNAARQLTEALDHLHSHGYVHRDIKPANLMLAQDGRIVLSDFGTVMRFADGVPYEVGQYGTPAFLAPEQIEPDGRIDGRSDLYAAGMILYLMVAGRKPFYGGRDEVLAAHLHTPPPPPSDFAFVSPDLEMLILRSVAKDPDDRFQTGAEFSQALAEVELVPEPAKPSLTTRLFGWMRPSSS